ncbi:MAG: hypothetical protein QOI41_809 [Myxococcales bacterium]|nr:hypothetical protein [Myxococcales bacterium]
MNNISARATLSFTALISLVGLAAVSAGCSAASADESVKPRLEVINQTKSALSADAITSITGTYGAACSGRSALATDTWTVSIAGGPASDELSVRKNDSDCVLTIDDIVTADGSFIGAPSIALDTTNTFKGSASAFALDGQPLAFYANAKIGALTFASDFTISLLVSDAPHASDEGNKGATFATQNASVSASTVPASDYTVSFASFSVAKDVNNVVQSVSGSAQFSAGSVAGQDYAVYEGALTDSSTLAEVDAAFAGAATTGLLADLTTLHLPASGFGLVGLDLDTNPQRTMIIRNTNANVSSYQLMLITFIP